MASEPTNSSTAPPVCATIVAHNNFAIGHLGDFCDESIAQTVLPNGACILGMVKDERLISLKLITEEGKEAKYLNQQNIDAAFKGARFPVQDCFVAIVRHGLSEGNTGKRYENPDLEPAGEIEAIQAGEALLSYLPPGTKIGFGSSPSKRTVKTAIVMKKVTGVTTSTLLDASAMESARAMRRPPHLRGSKAVEGTIVACDPTRPLNDYRIPHICDPAITEKELWEIVVQNRIPPDWRTFEGIDGSLLEEQIRDSAKFGEMVATTPLWVIAKRILDRM